MIKLVVCNLFILSLLKCNLGILNAQELGSDVPPPNVILAPDSCVLPPSLGYLGRVRLLEDCDSLDRFKDYPPVPKFHYGSAIVICCPDSQHKVYFPFADEYDDVSADDEYPVDYPDIPEFEGYHTERPETAKCSRNEDCISATDCPEVEGGASPPEICGWDSKSKNYRVCCKDPHTTTLITVRSSKKYDCDDFVPECAPWASKFPSSCTNTSDNAFNFMVKACMKSCNICEDRGCVDEFDKCPDWARSGHCLSSAEFMAINCRASCGICGFLSNRNQEDQVVNGRDYSNLESPQFDCGRSTLINPNAEPESTTPSSSSTHCGLICDIFGNRKKRDLPALKDTGEFFFYQTEAENSNRKIICASTLVSDRFIVSAAHCYINFQGTPLSTINSVILRDGSNHTEQIEMRRIFINPSFQLPSLYDDIAVIELGRRVQFDFDKYGDSPGCLGRDDDTFEGQEAIAQGYGFTEDKVTSDVLLESVNYIIDNGDCADYLSHNSSDHINYMTRLKRALSRGINDQLLCTRGSRNESTGVYAGPCEGDSGGPLFVDAEEKNTLVGIVSGGLGCGLNIPKWYTRVSSYLPWIKCIITNAQNYKAQATVELICNKYLKTFSSKNFLYS